MTHHLDLPWGRMAFTDAAGEAMAPPLLLLPGSGCDIDDWAAFIAASPSRGRIIALDFRSHGRSDTAAKPFTIVDLTDDTLALIAHLRLKRCVIAGHSLGGMVGLLAAERCNDVAGAVLLEGWTHGKAGAAYGPEHEFGQLDAAKVALAKRKLDATLARCANGVWTRLAESCTNYDARPYLARAPIPVTHLYGTHGQRPGTLAGLDLLANPRASTVWIPGAGHYLPHEKPVESAAACAKAMAAWTRSNSSRQK